MSAEHDSPADPRIESAVAELESTIRERYPSATFEVAPGEDPDGTYIWTTVDVDDTDEVLDVVIDRLLDLQVRERLPIHVIPIHTPERALATLQENSTKRRSRPRRPVPSLEKVL